MFRSTGKEMCFPSATDFRISFTSHLLGNLIFSIVCAGCGLPPLVWQSWVTTEGGGWTGLPAGLLIVPDELAPHWQMPGWPHRMEAGVFWDVKAKHLGGQKARIPFSSVPVLQAQMADVGSHFCSYLWCTSSATPAFQAETDSATLHLSCPSLPPGLPISLPGHKQLFLLCPFLSFSLNSVHWLYQFEILLQSFSLWCGEVFS